MGGQTIIEYQIIVKQFWGEPECRRCTVTGLLSMNSTSSPGSNATEINCICRFRLQLTLLVDEQHLFICKKSLRQSLSSAVFLSLHSLCFTSLYSLLCLFSLAVSSLQKSMLKELETVIVALGSVRMFAFTNSSS